MGLNFRGWNAGRGKNFSLSPDRPDQFLGPRSLCSFTGDKAVARDHSHASIGEAMTLRSCTSTHPYATLWHVWGKLRFLFYFAKFLIWYMFVYQ
jgi:hypothetical protein